VPRNFGRGMEESEASADLIGLGELSSRLTAYLRANARYLADDHEDLVQQTLMGLLHRGGPGVQNELHSMPFAFSILRRRIADRYRELVRASVETSLVDAAETPAQDVADGAVYEELLGTALSMIGKMEVRDRDLLLDHALKTRATPWTDAERQQLRRLRLRLRDQLAGRLRMSPREILKD
jgi:DNA-directed RNA polymerase specialized sigma24 family protein